MVAGSLLLAHLGTTAVVRWSRDQRVRTPPHPQCVGDRQHPLQWRRVMPFASWLQHRGHCQTCGAPIPGTLLAVEIATVVVVVAGVGTNPGLDLLVVVPMLWSAVVATPIDLAHRIIPNRLTHPLAAWALVVVTVLAATSGQWSQWRTAMIVGFGVSFGLLAVSLVYEMLRGQPGIGMGDIKWGLSIGITVGWLGLATILVWLYATVAASVIVMVGLVLTGRARIAQRVPYGPYLAFGVVVGILMTDPVIRLLYG